jgi:predicted TIM-barrel fold metal-dependent hydrolase
MNDNSSTIEMFDADNHYYEALDAFTRHMDPRLAKRGMQWIDIGGKTRLMVCGKLNRFIPNPTFDPVARPGCLDDFFRGRIDDGYDMRTLFGELEPIRPAYRDRDARLELMDEQDVRACFLFPTLGVGMEEAMRADAEITHAALDAFNRWIEDDWGYSYKDRLFAVPMISLMDTGKAIAELERVLALDARLIHLRSGPVPGARLRSPGDTEFDPFWARVNEAGVTVALHSGDCGYRARYATDWGESNEMEAFQQSAFSMVSQSERAVSDTVAAFVCHGLFHRFPNLRVCSIENGSEWIHVLLRKLRKAEKMVPGDFTEPAIETIRRHLWIAPYYEDDIRRLADTLGIDRVLMGSDFPHAEGLADPRSFVRELEDFNDSERRTVMHDNAAELATRRPA